MENKPKEIFNIPVNNVNHKLFERNREKADEKNLDHCPCCGKAITNPIYLINSIYGGCYYKADDKNEYTDAWVMGVGTECRKKFPDGYVFKKDKNNE